MNGRMPAAARRAIELAFLDVLRRRRPDLDWSIVTGEARERDTVPAPEEIGGSLAPPEDADTIVEGDPLPEHDRVDPR